MKHVHGVIPLHITERIILDLAQLPDKQACHVSSVNQTASKVEFAKQGCRVNGMAGSMDPSTVFFTYNDMMSGHFIS